MYEWLDVPVGRNAHQWVTRHGLRTVLTVVHTVTSGERVLEAVELLETDPRVQVIFTQAPDVFGNGVADLLRSTGGVVLPWKQVIREEFDLALAAAYGSLHQLHGPVAVMAHGAGYAKAHRSTTGELRPYGLDGQRLLHNGWVKAEWGTSENNRRARYYTLTAAGRKQLTAEHTEFDRMVGAIQRVLGTT